jgi:hypothetical protein
VLRARLAVLAVLTAAALVLPALPGRAAGGDIFSKGTWFCASTHPNHGTLEGFGPALDLGSAEDAGRPVYAPGRGRVRIHSTGWGGGFGNSIIWISGERSERIHLAHLASFGATGTVRAGEVIGRVGSTGRSTSPHVHASARLNGEPAPLTLGGRILRADRCYTSRGPVPPTCAGREATVVGTGGDDLLVGTAGDDVIVGLGGADRIEGRGGDDRICGGRGRDLLLGGSGADRLHGGAGRDALAGGRGGDRITGGARSDQLAGGGGPDVIAGGPGADLLDGGDGVDVAIFAGAVVGVTVDLGLGTASGEGEDVLVGVENVVGSGGADLLSGSDGPNRLFGMAGDDSLDGGAGEDLVDGGDGFDTCAGETVVGCENLPEPAPEPIESPSPEPTESPSPEPSESPSP